MSASQRLLGDVRVGDELPPVTRNASRAQLFLYSAATHNPHRIHYDRDYAAVEGHPDIIVHGPLQGAWLSQYVTDVGRAARPDAHADLAEPALGAARAATTRSAAGRAPSTATSSTSTCGPRTTTACSCPARRRCGCRAVSPAARRGPGAGQVSALAWSIPKAIWRPRLAGL